MLTDKEIPFMMGKHWGVLEPREAGILYNEQMVEQYNKKYNVNLPYDAWLIIAKLKEK